MKAGGRRLAGLMLAAWAGSWGCKQVDARSDAQADLSFIELPPGFSVELYARVPNARSLTWGDQGTLFAGNRQGDSVYAVVDRDGDMSADQVLPIAKLGSMPNGVAFRDGSLYVAQVNRILRYDDIESRLDDPPKPVVVKDDFPTDRHHGWKFIAFGPDGKLYVPVGAPCNVCTREDPRYASITRMEPDGSDFEVYVHGARNSVGFDWHPETGELWFTDNGRDRMGDNRPPDELNRVSACWDARWMSSSRRTAPCLSRTTKRAPSIESPIPRRTTEVPRHPGGVVQPPVLPRS